MNKKKCGDIFKDVPDFDEEYLHTHSEKNVMSDIPIGVTQMARIIDIWVDNLGNLGIEYECEGSSIIIEDNYWFNSRYFEHYLKKLENFCRCSSIQELNSIDVNSYYNECLCDKCPSSWILSIAGKLRKIIVGRRVRITQQVYMNHVYNVVSFINEEQFGK